MVAVRSRRAALVALLALATAPAVPLAQNQAPAPESPTGALARLGALLVSDEKPDPAALLAPSGLRIHLRLPAGREIGDEQQRYGPEQAAVLLRDFLASVEMRPFDPGAGPRAEPMPDRRVWVERPAPNPRARLRPHGILHLSVRDREGDVFEHQRLFVGLRETRGGWKVEEILHLP